MPDLHRLEIRSTGSPSTASIHLNGQKLDFVSRIEFSLDADGNGEVALTVPAAPVGLDVDASLPVATHVVAEPSDADLTAAVQDPRNASRIATILEREAARGAPWLTAFIERESLRRGMRRRPINFLR